MIAALAAITDITDRHAKLFSMSIILCTNQSVENAGVAFVKEDDERNKFF